MGSDKVVREDQSRLNHRAGKSRLIICDLQSYLHNFKIEFVDRPISEMLNSSIVDVLG